MTTSPPEPPPAPRNVVQVIGRAAAILRVLEGAPDGLSLAQIAARVGLARSTVQRITAALEAEKLLISASPTGRLRLGPSLLRLAAAAQTDLAAIIRPEIARLSAELDETVDLAQLRGDHLVFIDQVIGGQRLRAVSSIGESFPLYCSANGKAVLAGMTDAAIEDLIGATYPRRTPHTLTTLPELRADLSAVRQTGIGIDRQEHTMGICAAGIALRDPLGNVVAISLPVPTDRFVAREATIVVALCRSKAALTALLG